MHTNSQVKMRVYEYVQSTKMVPNLSPAASAVLLHCGSFLKSSMLPDELEPLGTSQRSRLSRGGFSGRLAGVRRARRGTAPPK